MKKSRGNIEYQCTDSMTRNICSLLDVPQYNIMSQPKTGKFIGGKITDTYLLVSGATFYFDNK